MPLDLYIYIEFKWCQKFSKDFKGGKSNFQYGRAQGGWMDADDFWHHFMPLELYIYIGFKWCQAEIFKVSKIAEPYVRQLRYRSLYNQGSVGEHRP